MNSFQYPLEGYADERRQEPLKPMRRGLGILLALCSLFVAAVQAAETADIVLVGGKIVTVDDRFTIAQAVAIRGQRIVAVGANADIRKLGGSATKVSSLAGGR